MKKLQINIEINGKPTCVGTISGRNYNDAVFQYAEEYLHSGEARPISFSLPIQDDPFPPSTTHSFFEGLLPEGFSRKSVANWAKVTENDYLSLLERLGTDCLGAITVNGKTSPEYEDYVLLSNERVKALAAEGATTSTKILMETHLSLTGATGKVGLYYDEENQNWYLPTGRAASTHIVKQSHVRLKRIVLNEWLCLQTAKNLGIPVSDSFIINVGDRSDENILFAVKRYDRKMSDRTINGLPVPYRLHQEDFSQALGIPASQKYEHENRHYLERMFRLLSQVSSNPIEDQIRLWDMICLHFLIGNTDCHLKNYSLLYDSSLKNIRLAPAYDIVCTQAYHSTKEMSFYIGDKLDINTIRRSDFEAAAEQAHLGKRMALRRFDSLANRFEKALSEAVAMICEQGYLEARDLEQTILSESGCRFIL